MKAYTLFKLSLAVAVAMTLVEPPAPVSAASKKTVAKKKKRAPTTKAVKAAPASISKNFTCTGSGPSRISERTVTGTYSASLVLTNVTVTQNYQEISGTAVNQPVVVVTNAAPRLKQDESLTDSLITYFLNELPKATASDIDKFAYLYQLNLPDKLPVGPAFEGGLYFAKYIGSEGNLANDQRWSITDNQAYGMKCTYV